MPKYLFSEIYANVLEDWNLENDAQINFHCFKT